MGIKEIAQGRKDIFMLRPQDLNIKEDWNARYDRPALQEHIKQLCESIKEVGVLEPLTVYQEDDKIWISNGFNRYSAIMLALSEDAEIKSVPCRVEDRHSNAGNRILSLITRNSGLPLLPLERANVIKRLLKFGWSRKEISAKTGLSLPTISNDLKLLELPEDIKQSIINGDISANTVIQTMQEHGMTEGANLVPDAVNKAKSKGKTRATAKDLKVPEDVLEIATQHEIPLECVFKKKGAFGLKLGGLDEYQVADVIEAVRNLGLEIV